MMGFTAKTKKACKEMIGKHPLFVETSMFGPEYDGKDGTYCVVGPSPYKRKWYANVTVKNDLIIKVT